MKHREPSRSVTLAIELERKNLAEACKLWHRARDLYAEIGMPHMVERVQGWIDEHCAGE